MWRFGIPVLIILTLLPLAACAVSALLLPETVPLHINIQGEIDRWGSKWELLVIMSVTSVVCNALCTFCYVFAPKLKSRGLLNAPDGNVGLARQILIGAVVFCDVISIGIIFMFTAIALGAV